MVEPLGFGGVIVSRPLVKLHEHQRLEGVLLREDLIVLLMSIRLPTAICHPQCVRDVLNEECFVESIRRSSAEQLLKELIFEKKSMKYSLSGSL